MTADKPDAAVSPEARFWAKLLVTVVLLFHATAVWVGAWAASPSSGLQRSLAEIPAIDRYDEAIRQGLSYRYYANPGPTPVVTATLTFSDGRPEQVIRLPERGTWPRLRYQRQLAMAHHLTADYQAARAEGDGSKSRWAHAFATHIGQAHPGCSTVTLRTQLHLVPDLRQVQERSNSSGGKGIEQPQKASGGKGIDLDADEFYTAPERIGTYQCAGS